MKQRIASFFLNKCREFELAFFTLCRFLFNYFSVRFIIKTFFSPWKRVYATKTKPGFSFEEIGLRISYNLISLCVGILLRTCLIAIYLIVQVLLLSIVFPLFVLYIPTVLVLWYPMYLFLPTEEQHKEALKKRFIASRLTKEENREAVNLWFERIYQDHLSGSQWWQFKSLFEHPPLARHWHMGFTNTLDRYAEELTKSLAHAHHLVGRKKEIDQIEQILSKSEESNVILVGEEGVGKRTILEEMAKRIYQGKTTGSCLYKRVMRLQLNTLLSEHIDVDQKKEIVQQIFTEASQAGNIILVIDSIDRYVTDEGNRIDLSAIIEPYAKTNRLQCIGVTTPFLYEKYIFTNEKIRRIFQKVDVFEIGKDEAILILTDAVIAFEKKLQVIISYEIIQMIVEKSEFYITHIPFPEKAIELLDEICAYADHQRKNKQIIIITADMVNTVLSQKLRIPTVLTEDVRNKLVTLEQSLSLRIIDQTDAMQKTASAIQQSFLLLGKRIKPFATLMFLGPTGVGKTQTAKSLASFFFGSESFLYRFDMSSYQTPKDIATLIGSSENGKPGLLTECVRNNPYGVLLLDEFEKAEKNLLNIFLTILDEAYFTDTNGDRVDCKNLIIVATSNAGSDLLYSEMSTTATSIPYDQQKRQLIDHLVKKHIYSPELLNRFDQIILFKPLSKESIIKIGRIEIDTVSQTIQKLHHITLTVSDVYLTALIEKYYDQRFGARDLKRILQGTIESDVATRILTKSVKEGETISL